MPLNQFRSTAALVEFAYVSGPAPGLPPSVILRLARQAWSFNRRAGLTGWLRFEAGRFLQVIEGPSDIVLPLSSRILADSRHGEIEITAFNPITRRRYPDWTVSGFDELVAAVSPAGDGVRCMMTCPCDSADQAGANTGRLRLATSA